MDGLCGPFKSNISFYEQNFRQRGSLHCTFGAYSERSESTGRVRLLQLPKAVYRGSEAPPCKN